MSKVLTARKLQKMSNLRIKVLTKLDVEIRILKIRIKTLKRLVFEFRFCGFSSDSISVINSYIYDCQNKLIKLLEKKSGIKF